MATRGRFGWFIAGLAGFTVVAAVLIWFVWSQLTDVLEGTIRPARDLIAVLLIAVLVGLMRGLGRLLRRFEPPS